MYEDRILAPELRSKVMSADDAAQMIKSDMLLGFSGFTTAGFPKAVPMAIASQGTAKNLTVITPASTGEELDGSLAKAGLLKKRYSFQSTAALRDAINRGEVEFSDIHLSHIPKFTDKRFLGRDIDFAIIECAQILEDGSVVPMASLGATNNLVNVAKKVILEVNTTCPTEIYGIHDIYDAPFGTNIPIHDVGQRIGSKAIRFNPFKIAAIVFTDKIGSTPKFAAPNETSQRIADHIVGFLKNEIKAKRIPENLAPLQSGVGAVGNAVFAGLRTSGLENLQMYTEVVQDSGLELIRDGIITMASTTALSLSESGLKELYSNLPYYKKHIVIRPQDISNHPGPIKELGVIAINTAAEMDIYGNINSSHATGSSIINGIGGSADFSRNARLSIFMCPSIGKKGALSRIVPMVSHTDNTEHDVNVLVTEWGVADIRGLSPKERAEIIIEKCCHPDYRPLLREYFERAKKVASGLHTPHDLRTAFEWHIRYMETGSMMPQD